MYQGAIKTRHTASHGFALEVIHVYPSQHAEQRDFIRVGSKAVLPKSANSQIETKSKKSHEVLRQKGAEAASWPAEQV